MDNYTNYTEGPQRDVYGFLLKDCVKLWHPEPDSLASSNMSVHREERSQASHLQADRENYTNGPEARRENMEKNSLASK